jgi:hypothetical protein
MVAECTDKVSGQQLSTAQRNVAVTVMVLALHRLCWLLAVPQRHWVGTPAVKVCDAADPRRLEALPF